MFIWFSSWWLCSGERSSFLPWTHILLIVVCRDKAFATKSVEIGGYALGSIVLSSLGHRFVPLHDSLLPLVSFLSEFPISSIEWLNGLCDASMPVCE